MKKETNSKQSLTSEGLTSDSSLSTAQVSNSTSASSATIINHRIFLVRHGDVDLPSGVCYGQLDCAVTSSFNKDVQKLIDYFQTHCLFPEQQQYPQELPYQQELDSPIIITSPLKRCAQLAEGLQAYFDNKYSGSKDAVSKDLTSNASSPKNIPSKSPVQINQAFKEINFGQWEGLNWQSIGQEKIEEWNNDLLNFTFPNGENASGFDQRVVNAWQVLQQQLAQQTKTQQIIIICHAGVIRSILSDLLQIPLQHSLTLQIDKMSVSSLKLFPNQSALSRCIGINHQL
ncbi:histidine phosphatase family protein [Psychromonas sp. SR45-3]|uniref:histidine phosphatase family protein n=1 Tax=Psychromonas sp. SR45-3 TaxID=2760930 RepID=UPI0015FBAAB3|nr:histidine phosphatase family protein [Psychromonas sp. SR45-3]MBB1273933.1 histidine phosphatase family protein [Psychromonas sp. SR45-3]